MVKATIGDIFNIPSEAIAIPSNGLEISSQGLGKLLQEATGPEVEKEFSSFVEKREKAFEEGRCVRTNSGNLHDNGVKYIYHAIIQQYPNSRTSYKAITDAINDVLNSAVKDQISLISFSPMGYGLSEIDMLLSARILTKRAMNYAHLIDVNIIDFNQGLINEIRRYLEQ